MPSWFSTAATFDSWLVGMCLWIRARVLSTALVPHHWFQRVPCFAHLRTPNDAVFPFSDVFSNQLKLLTIPGLLSWYLAVFSQNESLKSIFSIFTSYNIPSSFISALISGFCSLLMGSLREKMSKLYSWIPPSHQNNFICCSLKL